ncbi:hypothetical protein AB9B79_20810, partial [Citrobacter freundii]|uniref:hypothetical protein n=1 Tax=Enterobacteriaceae TaxID=543 RepID=UPI0035106E6F
PQNDVTLKMPAFEWVHVQLHQQKGMISLSPPTICNSAGYFPFSKRTPMRTALVVVTGSTFPKWLVSKRHTKQRKRA